jgi:hypothetical protein
MFLTRRRPRPAPETPTNIKVVIKTRKVPPWFKYFGKKIMSTATITWVDPPSIAPDTFTVDIFDSLSPTPSVPVGSVAQGVQTFTTGPLAVGTHVYTLDAVNSEGVASAMSKGFSGVRRSLRRLLLTLS